MLTQSELKSLEKDFIYYLASHGISADRWQEIQEGHPDQERRKLIEFSDLVLQRAYSKCRLVEEVSTNGWLFYFFDDEKGQIDLIGFVASEESNLDFRNVSKNEILNYIQNENDAVISIIRASKPQQPDKANEIHLMLERGAFISRDLEMFDKIKKLTGDV